MAVFRWIPWNLQKIASHGVSKDEAEQVVEAAKRPYPMRAGGGKWIVVGQAAGRRLIQVVFLYDDEENGHDTIFVIHARPLTHAEQKRLRRRRRR